MTGPNILFWDIETSPVFVATWSLFQDHNSHDNILEDWKIICAAWKWQHSKDIHTVAWKPCKNKDKNKSVITGMDDSYVVRTLYKVLSVADIIVAQNGDNFDWKKFQTRCIDLGLPPMIKPQMVDTLKVARKEFRLTSNRLDYLGKYLGVGAKVETPKDLHMKVIRKEKGAMEAMLKYNRGDVSLLERVYKKLLPYIRNHPNYNAYVDDDNGKIKPPCCTKCGSDHIQSRGKRVILSGVRRVYGCATCGNQMTGQLIKSMKLRPV